MTSSRTIALTSLAIVAFASNSLLCRIALGGDLIDAASFTSIRILSGAIMLALIASISGWRRVSGDGSWRSGFLLFAYAVTFSYAYVHLAVAAGALILFAAVQACMMVAGLWGGERLRVFEWTGVAMAVAGLVYLLVPGMAAPPIWGSVLMAIAGVSWGIYSLRGRGSQAPVFDTAGNFVWAIPFALATSVVDFNSIRLTSTGIQLALISGAIASGIGYVIWYTALRGLSAMQASLVQLLVPVIAAAGGVVILAETLTLRLLVSAILILGGVSLGVAGHFSRESSRIHKM
jgi:drug/metabolite transporter (DMT)-like permease